MRTVAVDQSLLHARPMALRAAAEPTVEQAASVLLALRMALSAAWPAVRAATPRLSNEQKVAWNAVVWRLIDAELKLVRRLDELGVRAADGRPAGAAIDEAVLRRAIGVYGSGHPERLDGHRGVGLVFLGLVGWAAYVGVGLAISTAGAALAATVKYVTSDDLAVLSQDARLVEQMLAAGLPPEQAGDLLDRLRGHEGRRQETRMPGWAKGLLATAIGLGVVAIGAVAAWRLIPRRAA